MRILLLHADWIEFEPKQVAVEEAEKVEKKPVRVEEALVAFVTVEKGDDVDLVPRAADEIMDVFKRVKAERVVIYPWAHLSSELAPPYKAFEVLKALEEEVKSRQVEVVRAPFGWYKAFKISVKGHPLAELSRQVKREEGKAPQRVIEKRFVILTPQGEELNPTKVDITKFSEAFQVVVKKEALKEELEGGEPKILTYLKRFGFEWEAFSDYGHMRYEPYAALIFDLAAEYSRKVVREIGIPVFEVKGTSFFDLKRKPVREHAELYGDRLYLLKSDRGDIVLRYAACHQQFSMIKDWGISYKNLPFGAFEIADSYRYEQSGEVELCFRLRRFFMPDFHIFVKDEEEAKKWLMKVHKKILEEMRKIGREYEILVNVVSPEQYERYKSLILDIARDVNKPVLVCIYHAPGLNYYWTINIEYMIVDHLKRPREIGTVQIDIGNAKRFGIKYVDKDGSEKYPVILHTAIIGSLERFIYALFDTALRREKPMLPVWISPVQVRVIPVTLDLLPYAEKVASMIEEHGFRVDIDDTDRGLSRKIVDAEREWIPYVVVVGKREAERGTITVRRREDGSKAEMKVDELIKELEEKTRGYPKRSIYFSKYLSKRPVFMRLA